MSPSKPPAHAEQDRADRAAEQDMYRRLANIEHELRNNAQEMTDQSKELTRQGVKLDALYGNGSGRIGAVERIENRLSKLGDRVTYGYGAMAAAIVLVGWWITHTHK